MTIPKLDLPFHVDHSHPCDCNQPDCAQMTAIENEILNLLTARKVTGAKALVITTFCLNAVINNTSSTPHDIVKLTEDCNAELQTLAGLELKRTYSDFINAKIEQVVAHLHNLLGEVTPSKSSTTRH